MKTCQRKGFSLIELMVVLAIIAILAALLFPALQNARDRSKTVKCSNNLRQIGTAYYAYLAEHNGFFPYENPECPFTAADCTNMPAPCITYGQNYRGGFAGGGCSVSSWNYVLKPYLGVSTTAYPGTQAPPFLKALLQCPSNPWPFPASSFPAVGGPVVPSGYVMNLSMFPMSYRCSTMGIVVQCAATGSFQDATPVTSFGWDKRVNLSNVENPSAVALMGEVPVQAAAFNNPWDAWYPFFYCPPNMYGISCCSATNLGFACSNGNPHFCDWAYPDCNANICTWHNHGMNALIVDGHVDNVQKNLLIQYSIQSQSIVGQPNGTPGGLFWTDGKGTAAQDSAWYANQSPGGPYPE